MLGIAVFATMRVVGQSPIAVPATTTVRPAFASMAATAPRRLNSTRLATPPTIDGNLSDWPSGTDAIDVGRATCYAFTGKVDSDADLSAIVRSGWSQQTLYFAIQVTDDVIVNDSTDVWRDDCVEIGLDGLRDKYGWGDDDHQYTVVSDGRLADRGLPTTEITAAVHTLDTGYQIEVAIPMTALITSGTPISGTLVGFTIGLRDDDDGGSWDGYLIWEGTSTTSMPELFGELILAERLQDRIAALEARIVDLEQQIRELLVILAEFENLKTP
jgi:hypothetical protein